MLSFGSVTLFFWPKLPKNQNEKMSQIFQKSLFSSVQTDNLQDKRAKIAKNTAKLTNLDTFDN